MKNLIIACVCACVLFCVPLLVFGQTRQPVITNISQNGGRLIFSGMNFATGATVWVIDLATNRITTATVVSLSSTQIVIQIPSGISGAPSQFRWLVINPDGQRGEFIPPSLSVKNSMQRPQLRIFPNPTHESITIETSMNAPSNTIFLLRNALGQELTRFAKDVPSGTVFTPLPVQHLPTGTYFLEVQSGSERTVERFVKY